LLNREQVAIEDFFEAVSAAKLGRDSVVASLQRLPQSGCKRHASLPSL
jgi:hypothetical protein